MDGKLFLLPLSTSETVVNATATRRIMYILKFREIYKTPIWGGNKIATFKGKDIELDSVGESWEISAVEGDVSIVANGEDAGKSLQELVESYGARLMGKHVANYFGKTFPLLVKFIDAHDDLSIQVHPDDELARRRHNSFGKTEMWYVISAEPNAGLYSGLSQAITPDEYMQRVADNTIMDVLQFHSVEADDVFYLPSGRIHAIGRGVFIAEIQQTSNITYRIYDYNRKGSDGKPRELHTEYARDAIDYKLYDNLKTTYLPHKNEAVELVDCPYFTTSLLDIDNVSNRPVAIYDSFVVYVCMQGRARIEADNDSWVELAQGETCLVPAEIGSVVITPLSHAKMLECYVRDERMR